jgi:hypothetical protein
VLYSIGVHLSASECLGTMSFCQAKAPVSQGPAVSPSPVGELNVTICGTDRCLSASSSVSSSPNGGDAHGEMGNPSAAEGGGGAGGGAAGRRCDRRWGWGSGIGDPVREAGAESARCGGGT